MLEAYVYVIVGFLGLAVGSFLNVLVLRGEREESLMGRSHCPTCKRTLTWYELVPVFSYLVQRGRCRGCRSRISLQYPLVELATCAVFLILAHKYLVDPVLSASSPILHTSYFIPLVPLFHTAYFVLHAAIWSLLVAIFVYDLHTKLIPDRFSYAFAALALFSVLVSTLSTIHYPLSTLANHFIAGVILSLPFYLLWKMSDGRWMGLGDAKLAVGIGWYLGLSGGAAAIILAFWIGAAVSLILIGVARLRARISESASGERLTMKSEVPFGPYLIVGTAVAYLYSLEFLSLFAL